MLKKILIALGVLVAGLLVLVSVQPAEYHVERTIQVQAQPQHVWAEIQDFKRWKGWNPWEKSDPTQTSTYEGEAGTVGHKTTWSGQETGKGSMTVVKVDKPTRLALRLDFIEPWAGVADTAFDIAPKDNGVEVKWSMDGKNDFMGKAMSLFMNMDSMVGPEYEKGLADIKKLAEENAKKQAEIAAAAKAAEEAAKAAAEADEAAAEAK